MSELSKIFDKIDKFMDLQNVKFENKSVKYNGQPQTIVATDLPDGVTVAYEPNNTQTAVGVYEITATFTETETSETDTKVATLTITKKDASDVSKAIFVDDVHTFENKAFNKNEASNLPSNVTVKYTPALTTTKTAVSTTEFTAEFMEDLGTGTAEKIGEKKANLIINKKPASDLKAVVFVDDTYVYNGQPQAKKDATNVPNGVTVVYDPIDKTLTNVGNISIKAIFSEDLGTGTAEKIDEKLAKIIISKKPASDLSGVKFDSKTVTKDGQEHTIDATNLPDGVTVTYTPENKTLSDVGSVEITAEFSEDLGTGTAEKIGEKKATLTITDKEIPSLDDVIFESIEVEFDGEPHTVEATNLPDEVTVTYEPSNTQTEVGTHEITATFTFDGEVIGSKKATIKITKKGTEPTGDLAEITALFEAEYMFNYLWLGSLLVDKELTMELFMEFMEEFVKIELLQNPNHYRLVEIYNSMK